MRNVREGWRRVTDSIYKSLQTLFFYTVGHRLH